MSNGMGRIEGKDYNQTFIMVVKPMMIRLVLTIVITNNLKLHQVDIGNVFLHGRLNENIVMRQPLGYVNKEFLNRVCRLKNTIYNLQQSACMLFRRLRQFLFNIGFKGSTFDASLSI